MKNNILVTVKKEIRGIMRDRKSLLMMIVTPLMIPLFIFVFSIFYDDSINNEKVTIYNAGINYLINDIEGEIIKNLNLELSYFETEEQLKKEYENGNIDAYIILKDEEYLIYYNNNSEDSSIASSLITTYLDNYNSYKAQEYLTQINADTSKVYNNIVYDYAELTGKSTLVDLIVTTGFIFAIMSITLTAIYCATDSTAGEKERGTLETFLTFPIKSNELIIGKYFAISLACFVTTIISIILTIGSLTICRNVFEIYKDVVFNLNMGTGFLVFVILISYSLFISGATIAIASFSKTYKEAQSTLTPISMVVMVPMFLDLFGITMSPLLSLVPVISHTLLINEIFYGTVDIFNVIVMFISTIIYICLIIWFITKQYKSEKILFSA